MEQIMNPSFILYSVCSVDGYIARENGDVDWLSEWPPATAGCGEILDSVDGLVMGARTYDHISDTGKWAYGSKPCLVLSNVARKPFRECVEFFTGKVEDAAELMRQWKLKRVWLVGGASTFTQFHRKKLIDDYIIAIVPIILGSGTPLLRACDIEVRLKLVTSRAFETGLVLNHYRRI
ncbi:MAG: dihydrofolate reductase family protein [Thermodesulfobacteriota bacterium]